MSRRGRGKEQSKADGECCRGHPDKKRKSGNSSITKAAVGATEHLLVMWEVSLFSQVNS